LPRISPATKPAPSILNPAKAEQAKVVGKQ